MRSELGSGHILHPRRRIVALTAGLVSTAAGYILYQNKEALVPKEDIYTEDLNLFGYAPGIVDIDLTGVNLRKRPLIDPNNIVSGPHYIEKPGNLKLVRINNTTIDTNHIQVENPAVVYGAYPDANQRIEKGLWIVLIGQKPNPDEKAGRQVLYASMSLDTNQAVIYRYPTGGLRETPSERELVRVFFENGTYVDQYKKPIPNFGKARTIYSRTPLQKP